MTGFPNAVGGGIVGDDAVCIEAAGAGADEDDDDDDAGGAAFGSAVIRSISVVPDESAILRADVDVS